MDRFDWQQKVSDIARMTGTTVATTIRRNFDPRVFVLRCREGHQWERDEPDDWLMMSGDVKRIREAFSHILVCRDCLAAQRGVEIQKFDDPDYLRVPGGVE